MSYQVTIKDSARQFSVEADGIVLDAAVAQDVGLAYGCKNGHCGACRAKLISGSVRYDTKPEALSDIELRQGYTLLCQARAQSDLMLEVEALPSYQMIRVRNLPVRVARKQLLSHDV